MKREWDVQFHFNRWFSLGVHIDHVDPSITVHLPLAIISVGRLKQPGYVGEHDVSLRRFSDERG